MVNETKVLETVKSVTDINAYFINGTLFLETNDSAIATNVFFTICDNITSALSFVKCGNETAYDFIKG